LPYDLVDSRGQEVEEILLKLIEPTQKELDNIVYVPRRSTKNSDSILCKCRAFYLRVKLKEYPEVMIS